MIVPAGDERRPKLTDFVNLLLFVHEKLSSIKSNILLPFFNCNEIANDEKPPFFSFFQ
jgi:hypothetical protein